MISSVTERRTKRSLSMPSYRLKSSAGPNRTPTRPILGSRLPIGCTFSVLTMTTGITGTLPSSAMRATPVLPR